MLGPAHVRSPALHNEELLENTKFTSQSFPGFPANPVCSDISNALSFQLGDTSSDGGLRHKPPAPASLHPTVRLNIPILPFRTWASFIQPRLLVDSPHIWPRNANCC